MRSFPQIYNVFPSIRSCVCGSRTWRLPDVIRAYNHWMPHKKAERDVEAEAAGQAGDTQGISDIAEADSESVEELLEEGQSFEAGVVSGVERAPDPNVAEVTTREVPEDDVPQEYLEND